MALNGGAATIYEHWPLTELRSFKLNPTAAFLNIPQRLGAMTIEVNDGPWWFSLKRVQNVPFIAASNVKSEQVIQWTSAVVDFKVVELPGDSIQVRCCGSMMDEYLPQGWNGNSLRPCDPDSILRNAYPDPLFFLEIRPLFNTAQVRRIATPTGYQTAIELFNTGGDSIARSMGVQILGTAMGQGAGITQMFGVTPVSQLRARGGVGAGMAVGEASLVHPAAQPIPSQHPRHQHPVPGVGSDGLVKVSDIDYVPPARAAVKDFEEAHAEVHAGARVSKPGSEPPSTRALASLNLKSKKIDYHVLLLYAAVFALSAGLLLK